MAKTNKEIRSELADKYINELKKVDEKIAKLIEQGSSEEDIKLTRNQLISNLQDELSKEDGYEEAKKTYLEEKQAKKKFLEAKKTLEMAEKTYENAQLAYRGKKMDQETIDKLSGNKERIIDYLKTNCLDSGKKVEKYGVNCTRYSLNLPAVNGFKGKQLEWFTSDYRVLKKEYDGNKEWKSNSISVEYTLKILCLMRDFMENFGIHLDKDVDFEKDLLEGKECKLQTLNCLKEIAGLKDIYRLKDWKGDSRAKWQSYDDGIFNRTNNDEYFASLYFIK